MFDFYALISHIGDVLKKRTLLFLITLTLFLVLYSFFFALFTIPFLGGVFGFYRMTPPTTFEYFYMFISSLISALVVTITIHRAKMKISEESIIDKDNEKKGKIASILGLTTGVFGAVCPACLGINLLLFGNIFSAQLSFLIPYIFWIQLGGLLLLFLGLYFVTKVSYEKKCITCVVENVELEEEYTSKSVLSEKFIVYLLVFSAVGLLSFQLSNAFNLPFSVVKDDMNMDMDVDKDIKEAIAVVTPDQGFVIEARWGGIVSKMVSEGVLDPAKLENILKTRYKQEMKPEWKSILAGEDTKLEINSDNAVFMMYLLWDLAKSNNNQILLDSPLVKYFKNYDIGVGSPGYGNVEILQLTPEQQKIAKEVAENSSRPCCNNSTAVPDCSHGYSALGLVELMASQGFGKEEIFDAFVKFNSFWFPETYIKDALYFKLVKGKDWSNVDKQIIAGKDYSGLSGSYKIKNYLKTNFGI